MILSNTLYFLFRLFPCQLFMLDIDWTLLEMVRIVLLGVINHVFVTLLFSDEVKTDDTTAAQINLLTYMHTYRVENK